jgi:hypothetical protein
MPTKAQRGRTRPSPADPARTASARVVNIPQVGRLGNGLLAPRRRCRCRMSPAPEAPPRTWLPSLTAPTPDADGRAGPGGGHKPACAGAAAACRGVGIVDRGESEIVADQGEAETAFEAADTQIDRPAGAQGVLLDRQAGGVSSAPYSSRRSCAGGVSATFHSRSYDMCSCRPVSGRGRLGLVAACHSVVPARHPAAPGPQTPGTLENRDGDPRPVRQNSRLSSPEPRNRAPEVFGETPTPWHHCVFRQKLTPDRDSRAASAKPPP